MEYLKKDLLVNSFYHKILSSPPHKWVENFNQNGIRQQVLFESFCFNTVTDPRYKHFRYRTGLIMHILTFPSSSYGLHCHIHDSCAGPDNPCLSPISRQKTDANIHRCNGAPIDRRQVFCPLLFQLFLCRVFPLLQQHLKTSFFLSSQYK